MRRLAAALWLIGLASGCTTMTAPILRHETGEVLGKGHYRVYGRFEQSRLFTVPTSGTPAGVEQDNSVFRGTLLGFQGAAGLTPKIEAQLGGFFSSGGGGWRVGTKYQFKGDPYPGKPGGFAVSGMLGMSRYSGSGNIATFTGNGPEQMDIHQTLTGTTLDLSVPVSYRFSPSVAAYSGLSLFTSWINGSVGETTIAIQSHDYGANLGLKVNIGRVESSLEVLFLRVYDPFLDDMRMVPVIGVGSGITF